MSRLFWLLAIMLSMIAAAFAGSNPQDEQVVRNAYAKLAYATQARTVYTEAKQNSKLNSPELAQKLQANELRFEITEMTSGPLADIASQPYSNFVSRPDTQQVLQIAHDRETFEENGKRFTSYFANPHWAAGAQSPEEWDTPIQSVLANSGGKYSRFVAATITVRFQSQSRTYRALWLLGSDILAVDLVAGSGGLVKNFITESAYPSVLTDTSLRQHVPAVEQWLNSTQRFESSCKTGKQDVCCDSATMRCGVSAEDLRSTKPAPNTKVAATTKGGL